MYGQTPTRERVQWRTEVRGAEVPNPLTGGTSFHILGKDAALDQRRETRRSPPNLTQVLAD